MSWTMYWLTLSFVERNGVKKTKSVFVYCRRKSTADILNFYRSKTGDKSKFLSCMEIGEGDLISILDQKP